MSARPFNARAVPYTWDPRSNPIHGIAIVTRTNGHARAFIPTREDAIALATQLVELIDNPHTFNQGETL